MITNRHQKKNLKQAVRIFSLLDEEYDSAYGGSSRLGSSDNAGRIRSQYIRHLTSPLLIVPHSENPPRIKVQLQVDLRWNYHLKIFTAIPGRKGHILLELMIGARHRKLKSFLSSPMESLVHAPKSTERIRSINIISGSKRPNCAHTPTFIHTSPQLCSLRSRIGKSGKRGYKLRCLQCLWMWRWWALEAGLITGHYNIHSWCVLHHDSNDRPLPSLTTASTNTTSMECGTSRHPSPRYYRDLWVWTQVTASIIPISVNYTRTERLAEEATGASDAGCLTKPWRNCPRQVLEGKIIWPKPWPTGTADQETRTLEGQRVGAPGIRCRCPSVPWKTMKSWEIFTMTYILIVTRSRLVLIRRDFPIGSALEVPSSFDHHHIHTTTYRQELESQDRQEKILLTSNNPVQNQSQMLKASYLLTLRLQGSVPTRSRFL